MLDLAKIKKRVHSFLQAAQPVVEGEWEDDTLLREIVAAPHQPSAFVQNMREFYKGLDRYNESAKPSEKMQLVALPQTIALLGRCTTKTQSPFCGITGVDGLGLISNGRIYPGYYYNENANTMGFVFKAGARASEFRSAIASEKEFTRFADTLLHAPMYPAPPWPRV